MRPGPLSGYAIVDLSCYVAGPFAGMMLSDLGADVVKVEPPRGDPNRRIGRKANGIGLLFVNTNRGKRGLTLDLKSAPGRAMLKSVLEGADAVIDNWRPGVAERLGIGPAALAAINPRLVHLSITGYGTTGPWADRGAVDAGAQAVSGLAWCNSHGGVPELVRSYVADKLTAAFAAQALLGALLRRERSGVGGRVEVNMLDALSYFNFPDMFSSRTVLDDRQPVDPENDPVASTVVRAANSWLVVAPATAAHIRSVCEACGHPEWYDQIRQGGPFGRDLVPVLMGRVEEVTRTSSAQDWVATFAAHDVPAAPVYRLDEHLGSSQVLHNGLYGTRDDPDIGPYRLVRYPARFDGVLVEPAAGATPNPLGRAGALALDGGDAGSNRDPLANQSNTC